MEPDEPTTVGESFSGNDPVLLMEEVVDMLKLLDYETKFCKQKGFKPFSKVYFAQSQSSDDQFL